MNKLNTAQICSIKVFPKSINLSYEYARARTFLFYFKRQEGFYYTYGIRSPKFMTKEEVEADNKKVYCERGYVFYKPHVEIKMSNQHCYTKFFEAESELNEFMKSPEIVNSTWIDVK